MEYIANHYVRVDGHMFIPGEIFQAELGAEKEKRLMDLGAIRKAEAPVHTPLIQPQADEAPAEKIDIAPDMVPADEEAPDIEPPTIDAEDAVVTAPKPKKKAPKTGGNEK